VLVLTRRINETILIGGRIRITVTAIQGRAVRVAIDAPRDVIVLRAELAARRRRSSGEVPSGHQSGNGAIPRRHLPGNQHRPA
jgi:carbon storage regulator